MHTKWDMAPSKKVQAAPAGRRKAKEAKETATANAAKRRERDSAAKAKEAAAAKEAAMRKAVKDKETELQATKAKE